MEAGDVTVELEGNDAIITMLMVLIEHIHS